MISDIVSESQILLNSLRLFIAHLRIPINSHVPIMAIHNLAKVCTVSWLIDLLTWSSDVQSSFCLRCSAIGGIDAMLSLDFVKSGQG